MVLDNCYQELVVVNIDALGQTVLEHPLGGFYGDLGPTVGMRDGK